MNRSTVPDALDDPSLKSAMRLAIHLRAYLPLYVMALGFVLVAAVLPTVNKSGEQRAGAYGNGSGPQQVASDAGGATGAGTDAGGGGGAVDAGGSGAAGPAGAAGKAATGG